MPSTILHLQIVTFALIYMMFTIVEKVLFLKKQLQGCKNKRCSHLHKGLAYYGRGDCEQAVECLHPLLELESLS